MKIFTQLTVNTLSFVLNEFFGPADILMAADDQWNALVNGSRENIADPLGAGTGESSGLFDDKPERRRFIH